MLRKWIKDRDDSNPTDHALQLFLKAVTTKYSTDALIVINENGLVESWNIGAENMFGWTEKDMIGHSVLPIIPRRYQESHVKNLENFRKNGISDFVGKQMEIEAIRKDGIEFPIRIGIYMDKSLANVILFTAVIQDISKEREIELKNSKIQRDYENYERIQKTGGWYWDLSTDIIDLTKGAKRIYEIDEDDEEDYLSEDLMRRIHIDDRKYVNDSLKKAFEEKTKYEIIYRIRKLNDEIVRLKCKGEPILDKDGNILSLIGTLRQISNDE